MTTTLRDKPIQSDADLLAVWKELMGEGGFGRRSLWLIFLDEDGRPSPVIVPIDDVPEEPDPRDMVLIANLVEKTRTDMGIHSVPMLLSRPGPTWMVDSDRRWAKALHSALGATQPQWPLHLATTDQVQVFAPDDLV